MSFSILFFIFNLILFRFLFTLILELIRFEFTPKKFYIDDKHYFKKAISNQRPLIWKRKNT